MYKCKMSVLAFRP